MNRGDWWGTVEHINLCVYNSCLVWPRYVGTVLAVNLCGQAQKVMNNWYEFMPLSRQDFCSGGFGWSGSSCSGNTAVVNDGTSPVFNPIACNAPKYVRAYLGTREDAGKKTRIFGIDENGQTIRTQNTDLTWTDGVELTLPNPDVTNFVSTSFKVREIFRITKDETQGVLRYYQFDADNNVLLDLVILEPTELSPMFRRSRLPTRCGGGCNGLTSVEALVKLEFIPVKYPTDLVLISNLDALADMMLAVKYSNSGDKDMAKDFEAKGIRELALELTNKYPIEQTPVLVDPFGSGGPSAHMIGQII